MSTERFFLDTAYVQALLNARDEHHDQAVALFPRVPAAQEVWVTEAIFVEVGNALARSLRKDAANFIARCYITANVRVVPVDTALLNRALELYVQRADKAWSLTDCVSFVVMRDHQIADALTMDEHFRQAGFHPLL